MELNLRKAVRNAIFAEESARSLYVALESYSKDERTKKFFGKMAAAELKHIEIIESFAAENKIEPSEEVDSEFALFETASEDYKFDLSDPHNAIGAAITAEIKAKNGYEDYAAKSEGDVKLFFLKMASFEEGHYKSLLKMRERYSSG